MLKKIINLTIACLFTPALVLADANTIERITPTFASNEISKSTPTFALANPNRFNNGYDAEKIERINEIDESMYSHCGSRKGSGFYRAWWSPCIWYMNNVFKKDTEERNVLYREVFYASACCTSEDPDRFRVSTPEAQKAYLEMKSGSNTSKYGNVLRSAN